MRKIIVAASLWMAALATPGLAADREACGAGLVCASDPQTVVKALQAAGYKALLSKSKQTGNPKIESAASGYDYRSEEHTSELQSLMRISYAVFCLKKKKNNAQQYN